jgi:hypothetical protein
LQEALTEMYRLARPGAGVVVIETLGTGREEPEAPSVPLRNLYDYLETEGGFGARWLRTDYRFASPEEAERLLGFFFGSEMADAWRGETIVPECTGIWSRLA